MISGVIPGVDPVLSKLTLLPQAKIAIDLKTLNKYRQ